MNKGKRVQKRLVPNPCVLETILEEETNEDETKLEEEEVPLQIRTQQAKATEMERRKSTMTTPPPTLVEPIELSSSEDEVQWWVSEQREQGEDVFSIVDFMPVGTELVGDKIRDTPTWEPQ